MELIRHTDGRAGVFVHPRQVPGARTTMAVESGVEKNILLKTWGGVGDQICAEPTLRYALKMFKNGETITLASDFPELFQHLKFADVYDLSKENFIADDFFVFDTNVNHTADTLAVQFMSHSTINCLDFPTILAFRCMIPIQDKYVLMNPPEPKNQIILDIAKESQNYVGFHCGKHWQSKTFDADKHWNPTIKAVRDAGFIPVLFGKEIKDGLGVQGVVDTISDGCVDLRDKTTLNEAIWLLQKLGCVITNDSSILHMAASGKAWIGFIASAKHPDYITHWRPDLSGINTWSWRMENLGLGGLWDYMDNCPNRIGTTRIDEANPDLMDKWFPDPQSVGDWAKFKMYDYWRER